VKVLVTGASGFAGRWLVRELEAAGHDVGGERREDQFDVTDRAAASKAIERFQPAAVAHLAAVSAPADVASDAAEALRVAVGGTLAVVAALAASRGTPPPVLLVTGSSEVYGVPAATDLPLSESRTPRPETPYALTKAAQEAVALEAGRAAGLRVVVTRSFNHTGPGQATTFAIPAFAERILAARRNGQADVAVGNLDVRRDISDVRDVVVAYRRLIEVAATEGVPAEGLVVNVGSGAAVSLRDVFERLARLAGAAVRPVRDERLVRPVDAPEIRADITRLTSLTGWRPTIDLDRTLRDVLEGIAATAAPA
jgi:GDP-4-dehydro-6-deoxy-D-mannose reductase